MGEELLKNSNYDERRCRCESFYVSRKDIVGAAVIAGLTYIWEINVIHGIFNCIFRENDQSFSIYIDP